MDETKDTSKKRRRSLMTAVTAVAIGALVVGGVIVAKNNSQPAQANLPAAEPVTNPIETPDVPKEQANNPLRGKGSPIAVAGTSPITGKNTTLSSLKGKPVVMMIWASWCPGCNSEAPHLSKVAAKRSDVHFFGLNYRDNAGDAQDFYAKYSWKLPSVEDPDGSIAGGLGLQGTPTTIFLDAQHREVGRVVGAMDEAGLEEAIDRLVGV